MAEEKPGGTPNTERFESEVAPFKKDRA